MKRFLYNCVLIVLFFCISQKSNSQCNVFPYLSYDYDCSTGQANVTYTIGCGTPCAVAPPYTITITNPATSSTVLTTVVPANTGTVLGSQLPVGNYMYFITTSLGCTTGGQSYQITVPFSSSSVVFTPTHVTCFGTNNGACFASATSPLQAPFTCTWVPTGPPVQTAQTATGLVAGVYTVTLKDSKGCMVTNSIQINQPAQISTGLTNTFVPCFNGTTTSGYNTTGGFSPFTYSVNGVATGSIASGISAGTQTITTKDNKGCVVTNTVLVNQSPQPVINFSVTKPSCPGSTNGAASGTISSAPSPFTYTWQPVTSFTNFVNNIPAGNYTLTVKDGSACITSSVVNVQPAVSISVNVTTSPENCSAADGSATLNVTGGNFPYTFSTIPVGAHPTNTLGSLSSGGYTTVITDANNCSDTVKYNVGNLSTVSVSISSFTPVLCYNQCTGALQLSVSNAVNPITYSVSGTPTTTSSFISGLCSGVQFIKVIDGIGCPATTTINFPSPPVFTYSANTPPSVCLSKSVSLSAFASGGAGGYTYSWSPGNLSGQVVTVIPPGTTVYSLNVYDANGCTLAPFTVTVGVAPPISININSSATGICPGTTAQITPTVTGGDGNYSYLWTPGNVNTSSIFVQNVLIPEYTLSVNDGCGSPTAVKIVSINLFPVIVPTYSISNNSGCEPLCAKFYNTTPKSTLPIWNYGDKPFEQQGNLTYYCYEKAGLYSIKLTVTDSNSCKTSFTYTGAVSVLKSPKAQFLTNPEVITLNNSENVQFTNVSADATKYKWFVGNEIFQTKDITYSFLDTGCTVFRLVARNNNNCSDTLDKQVCVIDGFNFWMPNCFTPNNDNLNEMLIPKGTGWVTDGYLFEVYNRWGKRIYSGSDVTQGWDGKTGEQNYDPSNVYFWRVRVKDNLDETHELKGHVTLLR